MERLATTVEQVLLGALALHLPGGEAARGLVRVEDLADPWHREVHRALAEDASRDLVGVAEVLRQRLGARKADLPRLHDLIRDVPIAPDVPGYAAMVVEASIRRQVAMTAVLVQACGLVEPSGGLEVRHSTTAVRDLVADLRARVEVVGPAPGDPSARAISRESADRRPFADERQVQEWWLAADRVLSATPSTDVLEGRDWEVRFVASLFGHRSQILAWAERIRPKWLTVRDWAPVLAALSRRAELGESLDVVSVCWDVQRASRVEGPGPGLVAVRGAVEASCWEDPDYLGRRVAANLLRRAAENAAASIRTAAANPGLTVHDVLATVEVMLDAIEWAAETLTVEPQPAAGSEPQPRAVIEPALDPQLRPPAELSPPAIGW